MCCVLRLALITLRVPLFCHGGSFCRLRACAGRHGRSCLWCGRML